MHMENQILVFGEVLWDLLPSGKKPGGAPSNFAWHANAIGASALINTRIGKDPLGDEICSILKANGLSGQFVQIDPIHPTGTVNVLLDANGQPAYEIVQNVAWDYIEATPPLLSFAGQADAFYFGSLAARSENNLQTLRLLLKQLPNRCLRIFDLNLRAPFYRRELIEELLHTTDVFKLNDEELFIIASLFTERMPYFPKKENGLFASPESGEIRSDLIEGVQHFMRSFDIKYVVLTAGSKGSFLMDASGNRSYCPAKEVKIADTVGAGDSFTAVCAVGLLKGRPLDEINAKANDYAAFICTQSGAMHEYPNASQLFAGKSST
ncbi:MAG: carbohydrate kinase [Planctomycetia bacterium]|nr:carbohydrate kinase [Planctomycetia bacterium]